MGASWSWVRKKSPPPQTSAAEPLGLLWFLPCSRLHCLPLTLFHELPRHPSFFVYIGWSWFPLLTNQWCAHVRTSMIASLRKKIHSFHKSYRVLLTLPCMTKTQDTRPSWRQVIAQQRAEVACHVTHWKAKFPRVNFNAFDFSHTLESREQCWNFCQVPKQPSALECHQ